MGEKRNARKFAAHAAAFMLSGFITAASSAEPQTNFFLKMSPAQRYWWVHGAVSALSATTAMRDEKIGNCIAGWFFDGDRQTKLRHIEEEISKHPGDMPTTTLVVLLAQACGRFIPQN